MEERKKRKGIYERGGAGCQKILQSCNQKGRHKMFRETKLLCILFAELVPYTENVTLEKILLMFKQTWKMS